MLLDTNAVILAPGIEAVGVPVILFCTTLLCDLTSDYPPLTSNVLYIKNNQNKYIDLWREIIRSKASFNLIYNCIESFCNKYNINFKEKFYSEKEIALFGWKVPEIIIHSVYFDFKRKRSNLIDKYYIGAIVNHPKNLNSFNINRWLNSFILIYISFGTACTSNRISLLEKIILNIEHWNVLEKNIKFIVHSPHFQEIKAEKIWCLPYCPQMEVLSCASLMINHGGGNSIKECMYFGVPMICYPFENDQYGNTNRVIHHHLGEFGYNSDHPDFFFNQINSILNNKKIQAAVKKFKNIVRKENEELRGVRKVHKLINKMTNEA